MGKVDKIGIKRVLGVKVVYCPPGDGEPLDPGWECHKPRERPGFRELDEFDYIDWVEKEIWNEGDEARFSESHRWDFTRSSSGDDTEGGRESE